LGFAADFTCAQFGSPWDVVQAIGLSSIAFDQCILEGTWVHISFAPPMRKEILIKQFDSQGVSASSTPFKGDAGANALIGLNPDRHYFETPSQNNRALPPVSSESTSP
jgi:hypothetical protein